MEKGILRLCALQKPFRLVQIEFKLTHGARYHSAATKFAKYLPLDSKCANGQQRTVSTQVLRQLRKQATEAANKDVKLTSEKTESIPGIPYSKITIGVPKETWQNERR